MEPEDHSFVADVQNWEARVKSELEASKQWYHDWGSLYAADQAPNMAERITALREKAEKIPGKRRTTNNSNYGEGTPYKEFRDKKIKKPDLI